MPKDVKLVSAFDPSPEGVVPVVIIGWYNPPSITLNTGCQAGRHWVPFLQALVWPGRGLNLQPTNVRVDTLPLGHWASKYQVIHFLVFCMPHIGIQKTGKFLPLPPCKISCALFTRNHWFCYCLFSSRWVYLLLCATSLTAAAHKRNKLLGLVLNVFSVLLSSTCFKQQQYSLLFLTDMVHAPPP